MKHKFLINFWQGSKKYLEKIKTCQNIKGLRSQDRTVPVIQVRITHYNLNLPYWRPSSQSNQDESNHNPQQRLQHEPVACRHHENGSANKQIFIIY